MNGFEKPPALAPYVSVPIAVAVAIAIIAIGVLAENGMSARSLGRAALCVTLATAFTAAATFAIYAAAWEDYRRSVGR